jgi:hypothetical protein
MDFDDLLRRYFATSDLAAVAPGAQEAGIDRMLVDFGMERDRGKRCAIWSLLYLLGAAPDLDVAFKDDGDREAARNFMDLTAAAEGE